MDEKKDKKTNKVRDWGNTSNQSLSPTTLASRNWVFTHNNYNIEDKKTYESYFNKMKNCKFIIGEEIGAQGTPHLQGFVKFSSVKKFSTLKKKFPSAHWEIAKGSIKDNLIYCSKEGQYIENIIEKSPLEMRLIQEFHEDYDDVKWYDWQQNLLNILENKPDRRTIHWFWEEKGNVGKSFLCKYIFQTKKAVVCNGKQTDIFYCINSYQEEKKEALDACLVDIPRENQERINYGTFEKIKDGLLMSGKYESKSLLIPKLHLIVFANFPPEEKRLSLDRWNIQYVGTSSCDT